MSGNVLIGIALAVVFAVLLTGLVVMFRGGNVAATWSNRLMRMRVLAQFVAIVIVMAVLYFTRR
jgi:hypothetical protein